MSDIGSVGHVHSLGEILVDQDLGLEERAKRAVRRAPFWVIALMVHVIVGAVLGMMSFRQSTERRDAAVVQITSSAPETPKIEEIVPKPEKDPEIIPFFDETLDLPHPDSNEFRTADARIVNPHADPSTSENCGLVEGEDPESLLPTPSRGGSGLPSAIGLGGGSGPGGGSPKGRPNGGTRIGARNAQSQKLNKEIPTVEAGLDWLARHQAPDGSWDPNGYVLQCRSELGHRCEGRGQGTHVAGVTGLALLAFLGFGWDGHAGQHQETVRNGLKWLRKNQDAEGCFGPRSDSRFTYDHACATIAMCEAFSSTRMAAWKKSAQSALDFIGACQNPYGAWRYGKAPGDADTSVTGWMIMALKAGKDAKLSVSERSMHEGLAYIDSMTDPESGRTGYTKVGEYSVRPQGSTTAWPATETEALTAVAMCSRIFAGTANERASLMKAGQELLEKRLPVWDEAKGSIDMYYWYYGTLAMFQMGGAGWQRWNAKLKDAVIDTQIQSGCTKGSWDPKDPWCEDGGRVYATALMSLCLEVYYRYPRVFGTK